MFGLTHWRPFRFCTTLHGLVDRAIKRKSTNPRLDAEQIKLQKIFKDVYASYISRDAPKDQARTNQLKSLVLTAPHPTYAITDYFFRKARLFSEQFLVEAWTRLAQAQAIVRADRIMDRNGVTTPISNNDQAFKAGEELYMSKTGKKHYKGIKGTETLKQALTSNTRVENGPLAANLFVSVQFLEMVEQFKYALSGSHYISWESIIKITKSMISVGYVDYEVYCMLIDRLEKLLDLESSTKAYDEGQGFLRRHYQVQKSGYYGNQAATAELSNDPDFIAIVERIKLKCAQVKHEAKKEQAIKGAIREINGEEIWKLIEAIQEVSSDINRLIDSVVAVRQQYLQMVELSANLRNLQELTINYQLLTMEQALLIKGLITIEDIKDPKSILDEKLEIEKVQKIVMTLAFRETNEPGFFQGLRFLKNQQYNEQNIPGEKDMTHQYATQALLLVAEMAGTPVILQQARDNMTYIHRKWEQKQLDSGKPCSRIFRRVYANAVQFFEAHNQLFKATFKGYNQVKYSLACHKLGLPSEQKPLSVGGSKREVYIDLIRLANQAQSFDEAYVTKNIEGILRWTDLMTVSDMVTCINLLTQASETNKSDRITSQHKLLVELLAERVKSVDMRWGLSPLELYEAGRILAYQQSTKDHFQFLLTSCPTPNPHWNSVKDKIGQLLQDSEWIKEEIAQVGWMAGANHVLFLVGSEHSSLNGSKISGNAKAHAIRIGNQMNVKVVPVSINRFVNIDYSRRIVQIKPKDQFVAEFNRIIPDETLKQKAYASKVIEAVESLPKASQSNAYHLLSNLRNWLEAISTERRCGSEGQWLARRRVTSLRLQQYKNCLQNLDPSLIASMKDGQSIVSSIAQFDSDIKSFIGSEGGSVSSQLEGRRLEHHLISGSDNTPLDFNFEIADLGHCQNISLIPYQDWKKQFDSSFGEQQVNRMSTQGRMLARCFLGQSYSKLSWQTTSQSSSVLSLSKFIRTLKVTKSPSQILDYILSFDFIEELNKSVGDKIDYLHRNPKAYFNFLRQRRDLAQNQCEVFSRILKRVGSVEKIKELQQNRQSVVYEARQQLEKGEISKKDYSSITKIYDHKIIHALKELQENVIGHIPNSILQEGLQMVTVQTDPNELLQSLGAPYVLEEDPHFSLAEGNLQEMLNLKRIYAQIKLQKAKRLGQIIKGKKVDAPLLNLSSQITTMTVGDLSKSDRNKLASVCVDLAGKETIALSDIVLELSHFINDRTLEICWSNLQKPGIARIISPEINQTRSWLFQEEEKEVLNECSKLNEQQLEKVKEMVAFNKTQGKTSRQIFSECYSSLDSELEVLNDHPARNELISEYVRAKEQDFYGYRVNNPKSTAREDKQAKAYWLDIFKKPSPQCSESELHSGIVELVQRFELINGHSPPYFNRLVLNILSHSKASLEAKELLISQLDRWQIKLNLSSKDVMELVQGYKPMSLTEIEQKLETVANSELQRQLFPAMI